MVDRVARKAEIAHRQKILTEAYRGAPQLMSLLNSCHKT